LPAWMFRTPHLQSQKKRETNQGECPLQGITRFPNKVTWHNSSNYL